MKISFVSGLPLVFLGWAVFLGTRPSPIKPVTIDLEKPVEIQTNDILSSARHVWNGAAPGPEHFTEGPDGLIYAGLADGRIVRFNPNITRFPETVVFIGDPNRALPSPCGTYETEPICGRPLGLKFAKNGRLIVADAYFGLVSVDVEAQKVTPLTHEAEGKRIVFANSVDIAEDGMIYFTDSSKFPRRDYMNDMTELRGNGRLLSYNPKTKKTQVLATGLYFPNGLLVSRDQQSVIYSETSMFKISRHYISGPKKSQTEVIFENFPCYPDNISWLDKETQSKLLVACGARRTAISDMLYGLPAIRDLIQKIFPRSLLLKFVKDDGLVLEIDIEHGQILKIFADDTGKNPGLSGAYAIRGEVYLGTLRGRQSYVARIPLEKLGVE